jgi:hypothetical protein
MGEKSTVIFNNIYGEPLIRRRQLPRITTTNRRTITARNIDKRYNIYIEGHGVLRESHEGRIVVTGNILKLTFPMAYPVWLESVAFLPIIQVEIPDLPSQVQAILVKM